MVSSSHVISASAFSLGRRVLPLLYCGSSIGSQVLQETCSSMGSCLRGSAGSARTLLQQGLLTGLQPPLRHPLVPAWGISVLAPGAPPPSPSPGVCRICERNPIVPLTYSDSSILWSHLILCSNFSSCFKILPQSHYYHLWVAWPWPAAGPSWHPLALALSDMGGVSGSSSQKPSL